MPFLLDITSAAEGPLDPLDALASLAADRTDDLVLLHSADHAGHSLLAWDPLCKLVITSDARIHVEGPLAASLPQLRHLPPLEALQQVIAAFDVSPPAPFPEPHASLPPLVGWLGFLSYDIGATLEHIPSVATDQFRWPLLTFALFRHYLLWDPAAPAVCSRFTLSHPGQPATSPPSTWQTPLAVSSSSSFPPARLIERQDRAAYLANIRRVQDYIASGDIYQANLAQRWLAHTREPPIQIFRRLCAASPAPYAAFMRFADDAGLPRHILSASPELFLTLDRGHAITRPIKGTRPRDLADPTRDAALRRELIASHKDRAELAMIVDLLRNDLGRVARFGSVQVTQPRSVEMHPTVWHTVATIEADLRDRTSLADLLAAICPGGSITGAPKIRAMQIIEQLEGFRRGLYCGNIGAISLQARSLSLNIAIRTILLQNHTAALYAGGGIVADSLPDHEYEETLHKAAALMRALNLPAS